MGLFGLILNIILLFISSLIPCGKDDLSHKLCSSVKDMKIIEENMSSNVRIYYSKDI